MKTLTSAINWLRGYDERVAEAMADPVRDGKFAIEDAKTEIAGFTSQIATLMAGTKSLSRKLVEQKESVAKFERIAQKAGAATDAEAVREALNLKAKAESQVKAFEKEISLNSALEKQLRVQLDNLQDTVSNAENNEVRLEARIQGSSIRTSVAKSAAGVGTGKGLSALENLAQAADKAESQAEAWEDMAHSSTEGKSADLVAKYDSGSGVSDDDVAKYMAKAQ